MCAARAGEGVDATSGKYSVPEPRQETFHNQLVSGSRFSCSGIMLQLLRGRETVA